jgi:hypothetical protein
MMRHDNRGAVQGHTRGATAHRRVGHELIIRCDNRGTGHARTHEGQSMQRCTEGWGVCCESMIWGDNRGARCAMMHEGQGM